MPRFPRNSPSACRSEKGAWCDRASAHPGRPFRMVMMATSLLLVWGIAPASVFAQRAPVRNADRWFFVYPWSYRELSRRQVVMQQRDFSCGAAALATIIRYYWGDPATEEEFLERLEKMLKPDELKEREENGLTLTDLRNLANKAGYQASIGKVEFHQLAESKVPVVVGLVVGKYDHFVVFRGTRAGWVYLADPTDGQIRIGVPTFLRQWQKNAILVVAKPGSDVKDPNPMGLRPSEIYRGWLNNQFVRQNALTVKPPMLLVTP